MPVMVRVGALCAVCGVAWAGFLFATSSSRFAVQTISVRGNQRLTTAEIQALVPIASGRNIFRADLDAVVRVLRANPWVASAQARRILPRTIAVEIRERQPVAIAALGGLYLVDANGHPFKRASVESGEGAGLPIITGLTRARFATDPASVEQLIGSALRALDTWRSAAERPPIGELHIGPFGALTLHTYDVATAIQLGIPDAGLATRLQTFDVAWAELGDGERSRARSVHLDSRSDHVTVAFAKE